MTDASKNEALEKLSQGIQESRQAAQQQTMKLAQEYFDDSVEELRQQVRDRRATLENLPDQVPGGREEAFQARFGQLMEKYSRLEDCLADARKDDGSPGAEAPGNQQDVDATDAARREARRLGIDLTQVEGTGSGGRIVIWDVTERAEGGETADQSEQGKSDQSRQTADVAATEGVRASDAARRKARELGVDLSEAEGTGSEGNVVVDDVTSLAESPEGQTTGLGKDLFG